jgi:uncharacterized membrane protein HdeD (DUF308 family)
MSYITGTPTAAETNETPDAKATAAAAAAATDIPPGGAVLAVIPPGMARNWWALALRGLLAVLFGLGALLFPIAAIGALTLLFGAYAMLDGVLALVAAAQVGGSSTGEPARDTHFIEPREENQGTRWWGLLLEGVAGIVVGLLTLAWPGATAFALVMLIAAWSVATGVFEIVAAVRLRRHVEGEWLLAAAGVLSILFGLALFLFPVAGAVAIVWLIGAYALMFGVLMIILGFRLRSLGGGPRREADRIEAPAQSGRDRDGDRPLTPAVP